MKLENINSNNGYGRRLLAALTWLTTDQFRDKTTDEVLDLLEVKATEMYGEQQSIGDSPGPYGLLHLGRGSFGDAVNALKQGQKVARSGWNGKGMFIYHVPAAAYPAMTEIAKEYFGDKLVPYNAYLAIKNVDVSVSTWVPSINDVLAEDWQVL